MLPPARAGAFALCSVMLEIRLRLGEDIPEPFNNALTLAAQFAAERYFGINYDSIRERNVLPVSSYLTVSQGIMGATKR